MALQGFSNFTFPLYFFFAKSMFAHGSTMVQTMIKHGFTMVKHVKLMMFRSVVEPFLNHGLSHALGML